MIRFHQYAATLIIFLSLSCSSPKETGTEKGIFSSRKLTPVIDAKATEWGDQLSYDNTTKTIYSIANDADNLYILVKAPDRAQQMKMMQGGLEIWLDPQMKKKKAIGIKYPLGGGNMEMPSGNTNDPRDARSMRQLFRQQLITMELNGFKDGQNGTQNAFASTMIKPSIDWDDKDNMVYELAISLKALPDDIISNLSNISIGFFIKGLKMPEGFSGMRGGGGGRPSGPPPGGGNMGSNRGDMESMTKDGSFWTKYTISK